VRIGRYGVAGVAIMAMLLALDSSNSILSLVSNAWAGFGAAFGPLVLYSLYYKKLTHNAAVAGIITGAVTVLFWIYAPILSEGRTLSSIVYEIVPGFILSSAVIWLVSRISTAPNEDTITLFNKTAHILTEQK
jgi:SSS family solute:Na+ symporter